MNKTRVELRIGTDNLAIGRNNITETVSPTRTRWKIIKTAKLENIPVVSQSMEENELKLVNA